MSRRRDAAQTKLEILGAARACFAEGGLAGTSTRAIASRAGVTQPLLHKYFGTKLGLFEAVLEAAMSEYDVAQSTQWALPEDDPRFLFDGLVVMFWWVGAQPELLRLSNWARLEGYDVHVASLEVIWTRLLERIEAARQAGVVREDVDPQAVLVAIDAMVKGYWERRGFAAYHTWSGEDLDRRVLTTIVAFACKSLLTTSLADELLATWECPEAPGLRS